MNRQTSSQRGFALVEGIVITVVLLLIAGCGYLVFSRTHTDTDSAEVVAPKNTTSEQNSSQIQEDQNKKDCGTDHGCFIASYENGCAPTLMSSTQEIGGNNASFTSHILGAIPGTDDCVIQIEFSSGEKANCTLLRYNQSSKKDPDTAITAASCIRANDGTSLLDISI